MLEKRNRRTKASSSAAAQKSRDYEVGKYKPPVGPRFKPGVSGNPNGRPPGRRKPDPTFGDILDERITITGPDGRSRSVSTREVIYRQLVKKAAGGDHRSIMAVKDHDARRAEGETNSDLLSFDPELASSILTDYEQEVLGRSGPAKRIRSKKR